MNKTVRMVLLGAIIGASAVWVSSLLAVEAQTTHGEVAYERGVYSQIVQQEIPCDPSGRVVLANQNGKVHVVAWDRPFVDLVARKQVRLGAARGSLWHGSGNQNLLAGAEWLHDIDVAVHEGPGEVRIETILPRGHRGVTISVDYELRVPRAARLELRTANGEVNVAAVQGEIDAGTSNGAVTIDEPVGTVRVKTSNGAIVCRDARGAVDLESSNGKITLSHAGPLHADGAITCTTSNGSIKVTLPQAAAFSLDARTSNGRVTSGFPVTILAGKLQGTRVAGTVGDGGCTVKLRTSNGGIEVDSK